MKHELHPLIEGFIGSVGLTLQPAQTEALLGFVSLLRTEAIPAGLVAKSDAGRLLERHVLDCLRGAGGLVEGDREAYDLGSGAGLPGIVLAIACPELLMTLVEARRRRAAILERMIRELGLLNAQVLHVPIERLSEPVDACFARALAPLVRSWELAARLLRPGGRLIYFAGAGTPLPIALPGASEVRAVAPVLASSGPLVIMTRR